MRAIQIGVGAVVMVGLCSAVGLAQTAAGGQGMLGGMELRLPAPIRPVGRLAGLQRDGGIR